MKLVEPSINNHIVDAIHKHHITQMSWNIAQARPMSVSYVPRSSQSWVSTTHRSYSQLTFFNILIKYFNKMKDVNCEYSHQLQLRLHKKKKTKQKENSTRMHSIEHNNNILLSTHPLPLLIRRTGSCLLTRTRSLLVEPLHYTSHSNSCVHPLSVPHTLFYNNTHIRSV